ncbi:MAG: hypothetical protein H0U66_17430 [Gemmatimonadaceae bacterium]|nr:hypothetical protein [Gemmatimonadaceae bacterium]
MTRTMSVGLGAAIVGAILMLVGVILEPRQALTSYLFAYATVLTIVLGALILVMLSYVSGAAWFTAFSDLALAIVGALPALAVLALPILIGVKKIYPWATIATLPVETRGVVERKEAWLNVPFFVVRALIYLAVWTIVGELVRRRWFDMERARAAESSDLRPRASGLSAGGLIVVGLALTFASFDWLMSLDPAWYSTVYGVYVFAGGFLAMLALVAVMAPRSIGPEQTSAIGKLLLTFSIFWAYIAFSQYLIIWIADVPSEVTWYLSRARGSWGVIAIVVAIGRFVIPFVLLLSRARKRNARALAAIGALLLAMHVLDVYWLVMPALHPAGVQPSWLDAAALLAVTGGAVAGAAWRQGRRPLAHVSTRSGEVAS